MSMMIMMMFVFVLLNVVAVVAVAAVGGVVVEDLWKGIHGCLHDVVAQQ